MSHGGLYQPVTRSSVCSTSTQAETKSQFLERLQISEYLIPPYLHLPSDNHEHLFNMNLAIYTPELNRTSFHFLGSRGQALIYS